MGDGAALGGGLLAGTGKTEFFANLGLQLGATQRLVLTGAQLRQKLEIDFPSGRAKPEMTQNAGGAAWRFQLGGALLDHAELNAYVARTASRDLGARLHGGNRWNMKSAGNRPTLRRTAH